MKILYQLGMLLMDGLMKLGSHWSPRLKQGVSGREGLFEKLEAFRKKHPSPLVWFHVASLGEYEQAKPVIAAFKEKYPFWAVAVSFFSPSGYEQAIRKKQLWVDHITYIPTDTPSHAKRFVKILSPDMAVFIKYDLWANHIRELKKQAIPLFLVAAAFRAEQVYFKWYGGFFRNLLCQFDHIFTQNSLSKDLLEKINCTRVSVTGDPRFDNVARISTQPKSFPDIREGINAPVMVLGSVWQEDMDLLIPWINQSADIQFILAPHDIQGPMIQRWQQAIQKRCIRYSAYKSDWQVLIIDNIGMLSSLYQFGRWAYVGGAFGKGLHNILEPLAFGIPVMFGELKQVSRFPEAGISETYGCGFPVKNNAMLAETMNQLMQPEPYQKACQAARKLLLANLGSAEKTIETIKETTWKEG
ncbi:3-deoxy-D-manno-octulosonic acid transferase [Cyclobacterium plantarum]|uniref:3-deoxy-D-manno-octulosonic acid transferase n=1 Tax=Cyclobacterium plantarum TaxID=2716263 RepID=A0ABX0HFR5_9BACT|nr:glycosyltransferase N-terminal domain-containing protein [Cyclobacterium plantarum]NHE59231.1 3-deoxy-D-manno-octulosonic acid transferase [Cyclobacterium plantarum]